MTTVRKLITALTAVGMAAALGTTAQASPDKQTKESLNVEQTIYFEFDSSQLDAMAKQELDDAAGWAMEMEDREVLITGHTDEIGDPAYNMELGLERAQSAKDYLVQQGVDPSRIVIRSAGEEQPVSDNPAENRRAVFVAERSDQGQFGQAGSDEPEPYIAQTDIETETVSETETKHGAEYEETTTLSDPITGVTYEESVTVEENNWIRTPMGMSVNVGGGVYGFFDNAARDFTSTGGSWDFRAVVGTREAIALEAAYVGTAQDIDALGLDSSTVLLGSQFEAAGRINILQVNAWQPYVVAGLGYGYFDLVNSDFNTSNVKNNDNIGYVPLAAGVSYRQNGFVFDLRGAVRAAWSDSMIQATANSEEADMDSWNVSAQLGWEF